MLLKEPACLSLNGISIEQKESHDHRFITVIPPLGWEVARVPHFPTFILATQIFLESDRIALPLLGSLSDASLKVACFPDGCEGRKECQCLSCLCV